MITVETPLRSKFARLQLKLQDLLLRDLGFLTLETEFEQLKFVEDILALSLYQQEVFFIKLQKKQSSKAYKDALKEFTCDYEERIIPSLDARVNDAVKRESANELQNAERYLDQSLNEI